MTYYSDKLLSQRITTTSGDIVAQIPSLTGYATETWVGNNYIDNTEILAYATLAKLTTTSGDIVAQIPSLSGYATQAWVGSNYIDNTEILAYATNSQLTTTSGDIVSQIPSLSGYATETWVGTNYIDNSEMTTISGDIITQINTASSAVVAGNNTFAVAGQSITHNLNTTSHATVIAPAATGDFDPELISAIGTIYVKLGTNSDIVYMTGDSTAEGIGFSWVAKKI